VRAEKAGKNGKNGKAVKNGEGCEEWRRYEQ
jgi:hypothetical protein